MAKETKKTTETTNRSHRNWIFWLVLFAFFCLTVYTLKSVLLPFVTGILIGYLFNPFAAKFQKLGMNRTLATGLVLLIFLIILVPALIILFSVIYEQISKFIVNLPHYITTIYQKSEPMLLYLQETFPSLQPEKVKEYMQDNAANTLKIIGRIIQKLISSGFALVNILSLLLITPIVAFYMLRDWRPFLKKMDNLLPRKSKNTIRDLAKKIDCTIAGFIRGQLSVCVILGSYYSTGLYFIGLELGVLIGFLAGLISFIPYIGSISGFVVSVAVAYAQFDSITPAIQVIIVFAIGQFVEGNFLTPKLVGENIGLHPVWVMFALLAGSVLLGSLGLLIAVPIAGIIGVLIRHAIENYKKSNLYLNG